jgi:hypothetical protein
MVDTWFPPVTSSGRRLRRVTIRSFEDTLLLVASGELVHPTVASFLDYYRHDGVVAVPIRDLPPSETGLVWLTANRSPKIAAFARSATDALKTGGLQGHDLRPDKSATRTETAARPWPTPTPRPPSRLA